MKRFALLGVMLFGCLVMLLATSSCSRNNRYRHAGYDSQTWIPRKHSDVPLKTYTGYPRNRKRR